MFTNYIKVALRNLIRYRGFTLINIVGLASSMAICLLIILFVMDQDRVDEHNKNASRIYRVLTEFQDEEKGRIVASATSSYDIKELLSYNVSEVSDASQFVKAGGNIKFEENMLAFGGLYASANFLDFFQFELLKGNKETALKNVNGLVISHELSQKLFGDLEAMEQIVTINDLGSFNVTGIIDDKQVKSHLQFDLLLPLAYYESLPQNQLFMSEWEIGAKHFYNYVKLDDEVAPEVLTSYLNDLEMKYPDEKKELYSLGVQRLDQINLGRLVRNELGITTPIFIAYFFGVLALVVMLSASFNYMNLSIARALNRAKEVGVRKVIGAGKKQIIVQFLVEAQLVMLTSLIAAFILLQVLVPVFNDLKVLRDIDGAITMDVISNASVYLIFLLFSFCIGLVAGVYPALYLASFKSLVALKGANNSGKSPSFIFRKILVFFQYSFSIIFIITTIILYQQANIFVTADYGFTHSKMINVPLSNTPYETFRTELIKRSGVVGVSAISSLPVLSDFKEVFLVNNNTRTDEIKASTLSIDPHAQENLGLEIIAGRNFMTNVHSDLIQKVLVNEKALVAMGIATPAEAIDQTIDVNHENDLERTTSKVTIIGVVKDFNYQFLFRESGPLIMNYDPTLLTMVNIRFEGNNEELVVAAVEEVWKSFDNVHPFEFDLYDYQIADIDDEFTELVQIVGFVSIMAIIIACMGQFSMVVHHVQLKVKEIGIRKVLGSSTSRLMYLLSKDFLVIILASILLATPLAWKINVLWTSKLYLSPEVSLLNLSIGIGIILIMALGTIFFLVRRAAHANPVDSLQYE